VPREERWYVVLADPPQNLTLSWSVVSLLEAEAVGRKQVQALGVKRVVPLLEGSLAAEDEDGEPLSTIQERLGWPGPLNKTLGFCRPWKRF